MRPSSSKERATGETTFGSLAASSILKPSRMTNVLAASAASTAGKRGKSLGSTSGSAARTDAQARQKVKRSGRMRNFTKFAGERPHNARGRKILAEQSGTVEMAGGFG